MFRILKQIFTLPFAYFFSESRELQHTISAPSTTVLLETQEDAVIPDNLLDSLLPPNIEVLCDRLQQDSNFFITFMVTKTARKQLADLFQMHAFVKQWQQMYLTEAYVTSVMDAVRHHVLGNIYAKQEQPYIRSLLVDILTHPQIRIQIQTQPMYAKLRKWLPQEVACSALNAIEQVEAASLFSDPDEAQEEATDVIAAPSAGSVGRKKKLRKNKKSTAVESSFMDSPEHMDFLHAHSTDPTMIDPLSQFELAFPTLGTYYTDESDASILMPKEWRDCIYPFFLSNQDQVMLSRLLDALLKKWESSSVIHPLYARAQECRLKIPFDIEAAKYYCLCLQIENIHYDLLEYSYIVSLVSFFHRPERQSNRAIRSAVEWVSQVNAEPSRTGNEPSIISSTASHDKEKLKRMIYDWVWLPPLKDYMSQLLQQTVQVELISKSVPLDILQRGNDLFGLRETRSVGEEALQEPRPIPLRWQDVIPMKTQAHQDFEYFLRCLCADQAQVYLVGSRVLSKKPLALKGSDFDFDIHFCHMFSYLLQNDRELSELTFAWLQSCVYAVWPDQHVTRCCNGAFNDHYKWFSYKVQLPNRDMDFRFLCTDKPAEETRLFSQAERCFSERASIWSFSKNMLYKFSDEIQDITKSEVHFTYNNVCYLLRCVTRYDTLVGCSRRVIDMLHQIIERYEHHIEDKQRISYIWYQQTKNKSPMGTVDLAIQKVKQMLEHLCSETDIYISPVLPRSSAAHGIYFFDINDSAVSSASLSPTLEMRSETPEQRGRST